MTDQQIYVGAERQVLGAMMRGGAEEATRHLAPGDFYERRHALLYDHILELWGAGEPTEPFAVLKRLADVGELTRPETADYLHSLYAMDAEPMQIGYYAGIVLEGAEQRRYAVVAAKLSRAAEVADPDARRALVAEVLKEAAEATEPGREVRRQVNLLPFLNGTYEPPPPVAGADRDDNQRLLYPGRWHTLVAPTGAGKSWFAVWHVVAELRRGHTVGYAHFEEHNPAGMIDRIRVVAPELTVEDLLQRFVWLDCSIAWKPEEFAAALPERPALIVLDGIIAACSQHGWAVDKPEAVGAYRGRFVTPATKAGAAVISLGHPVKARDRQTERHGFGASAWLDEVDGVAFRMESGKNAIRRGSRGYSVLFAVKDRYGQVEMSGRPDEKRDGWFYIGAFTVDSSPYADNVTAHLSAPSNAASVIQAAEAGMPTEAMAAVSAALAGQGVPLSQNAVMALVPGKTPVKRAALEFLVTGGYVAQIRRGNALLHHHQKPFLLDPEDDDDQG